MFIRFVLRLLVLAAIVVGNPTKRQTNLFELSVLHINDFHARFDETSNSSGTCKEGDVCIGGFSRLYKQIRTILDEKPDSVLLNGGDNFQGTLWYTVGKWNVTQQFLNKLPFDATVLGNHEFDDKIVGVVPFIEHLNHPVIVSNMDDSLEPSIQGLYNKSTIIERNGKKIGIIGVILHNCNEISSTGNLKFFMESPSVNEEAERLVREEGVFTNIVVSHSGYETEIEIAKNASEKISLIVGGHSHTFLYTGDNPPGPDTPQGPYPTLVTSKHGHTVLVTQASAYCKYLGNITIFLDEDGEIADYSGEPIFLANDFPEDDLINQELQPWKDAVNAQGDVVLGSTLVTLSRTGCYYSECTLGDFVTDAMVYSWMNEADEDSWTYASLALINAGGLRTDIQVGNITYADMATAQPFANTFDVGELQGKYIRELMEYSALPYDYGRVSVSLKLIQVSGFQVVLNITKPVWQRVESVKVRCQACQIPVYEDLDDEKMYRIVVPSFVVSGGDGFTVISDNIQNLKIGPFDMDVFVEYLSKKSPVFQEVEGRITIHGSETVTMKNMNS